MLGRALIGDTNRATVVALDTGETELDIGGVGVFRGLLEALTSGDNASQGGGVVEQLPHFLSWRRERVTARKLHRTLPFT